MQKQNLQNFINSGLSYSGIASAVGVSISTIRYWMRFYSLSTLRSKHNRKSEEFVCINCTKIFTLLKYKKNVKFCGRICNSEFIRKTSIDKLVAGKPLSPTTVRSIMLKCEENRCKICSNDTWNDKPIPLVVDHIDGNSDNNYKTNLRLICNNCDAQLSTYKARNKGNGRHFRRKRYSANKSY